MEIPPKSTKRSQFNPVTFVTGAAYCGGQLDVSVGNGTGTGYDLGFDRGSVWHGTIVRVAIRGAVAYRTKDSENFHVYMAG